MNCEQSTDFISFINITFCYVDGYVYDVYAASFGLIQQCPEFAGIVEPMSVYPKAPGIGDEIRILKVDSSE